VPIYEYACRQCGRQFEDLVIGKAAAPACPGCSAGDVERILSSISVGRSDGASADAGAPMASACGTCGDPRGPGACARN
jgi:putative FmdB family regulatory protein